MARRKRPDRHAVLRREIAEATLSGKAFVTESIMSGLMSLCQLRRLLSDVADGRFKVPASFTLPESLGRRCALPHGGSVTFWLLPPQVEEVMRDTHGKLIRRSKKATKRAVTFRAARTGTETHYDTEGGEGAAAMHLVQRCGGKLPAIAKVLDAIERTRKQGLRLIDHATRWRGV